MIFGKCQDRVGRFRWSKNDSKYFDVKLKIFKKDNNKESQLVQNLTMGEACFNQVMRLRIQLVIAAEHYYRGNFDPSADTYNVQRHGWTTQTGSEGGCRSGPSKQIDSCDFAAVQCGQAWEFLWSSPIICKEEARRELSTRIIHLKKLSTYLV